MFRLLNDRDLGALEVIAIEDEYSAPSSWGISGVKHFLSNGQRDDAVICGKIIFGDDVKIAPQCGFYTALHPLDAQLRATGAETAKPIRVGNNVWFGGGVKVLPGVTIGDNCVIGAGSVVTHDIPANSLAYGNPCRVIRIIQNS